MTSPEDGSPLTDDEGNIVGWAFRLDSPEGLILMAELLAAGEEIEEWVPVEQEGRPVELP